MLTFLPDKLEIYNLFLVLLDFIKPFVNQGFTDILCSFFPYQGMFICRTI